MLSEQDDLWAQFSAPAAAATPETPQADEWKEHKTPEGTNSRDVSRNHLITKGKTYYFNAVSKQTVWHLPNSPKGRAAPPPPKNKAPPPKKRVQFAAEEIPSALTLPLPKLNVEPIVPSTLPLPPPPNLPPPDLPLPDLPPPDLPPPDLPPDLPPPPELPPPDLPLPDLPPSMPPNLPLPPVEPVAKSPNVPKKVVKIALPALAKTPTPLKTPPKTPPASPQVMPSANVAAATPETQERAKTPTQVDEPKLPSRPPGFKHKASKRAKIVQELVDTERAYLENLLLCLNTYYYPLLMIEPPLISEEELEKIFGNMALLLKLNTHFILRELNERFDQYRDGATCFADIFENVWTEALSNFDGKGSPTSLQNVYLKYTMFHETAVRTVSTAMQNPAFGAFHDEHMNKLAGGLSLQSFLIMPVQRVPRYILFIEDLKRNTPDTHPDCARLPLALEKTRKVAEALNKAQARMQNGARLIELEKTTGLSLLDYGSFCKDGEVTIVSQRVTNFVKGSLKDSLDEQARSVLLLLFRENLVILRPDKKQHEVKEALPLGGLMLLEAQDQSSEFFGVMWDRGNGAKVTFRFQAKTKFVKREWTELLNREIQGRVSDQKEISAIEDQIRKTNSMPEPTPEIPEILKRSASERRKKEGDAEMKKSKSKAPKEKAAETVTCEHILITDVKEHIKSGRARDEFLVSARAHTVRCVRVCVCVRARACSE